jgi:hypothetical protein
MKIMMQLRMGMFLLGSKRQVNRRPSPASRGEAGYQPPGPSRQCEAGASLEAGQGLLNAQYFDCALSLAGRISRQVVHQPVSIVSTNSSGRHS